MRVWLAVRCFFKVLFDAEFPRCIRQPIEGIPAHPQSATSAPLATSAAVSQRSDAIALLATLQREARFVDIVSESLDGYSDAQIGAAARDVLRDSGKVLDRLFSLQPVVDAEEGKSIEVPAGYDAGRYRLTGDVTRQPPLSGQLMHAGWRATKCAIAILDGSARGGINYRTGRSAGWVIEGIERMTAKYVLGIDLGTTNSVLAYAALDAKSPEIELLEFPQLVAANTLEVRACVAVVSVSCTGA